MSKSFPFHEREFCEKTESFSCESLLQSQLATARSCRPDVPVKFNFALKYFHQQIHHAARPKAMSKMIPTSSSPGVWVAVVHQAGLLHHHHQQEQEQQEAVLVQQAMTGRGPSPIMRCSKRR